MKSAVRNSMVLNLLALQLSWSVCARAQEAEKDPAAVVELGGAAGHSLSDGTSSAGPSVAVEVTPIEDRLELEAGITALFGRHSTEWDADLLFKKPWTLSRKAELMIGAGPEWVHTRSSGVRTNAIAAEAVLDFMYWPGARHRFGWYLEPSYDYSFAHGNEQSLGISGGLLIAVGRKQGVALRHQGPRDQRTRTEGSGIRE